jgi:hypothetical protein
MPCKINKPVVNNSSGCAVTIIEDYVNKDYNNIYDYSSDEDSSDEYKDNKNGCKDKYKDNKDVCKDEYKDCRHCLHNKECKYCFYKESITDCTDCIHNNCNNCTHYKKSHKCKMCKMHNNNLYFTSDFCDKDVIKIGKILVSFSDDKFINRYGTSIYVDKNQNIKF